MYCKHCGKEIQEGLKYCPNCGGILEQATAAASQSAPAVQSSGTDWKALYSKYKAYIMSVAGIFSGWYIMLYLGLGLSIAGLVFAIKAHKADKSTLNLWGVILAVIAVLANVGWFGMLYE